MNTKNEPTYVKIRPGHVEFAFHVYFKEEGKFVVGYIPAYDITFTAKDREEGRKRAANKSFAFISQYDGDDMGLLEALTKLGFTSHEPATNHLQISKGKGSRGKLVHMNDVPDEDFEYESSEFISNKAA